MSNKLDKYKFIKEIPFIKSDGQYDTQEDEKENDEKKEYEDIFNLLMIKGKWDIIHEYMDIKKRTKEDCLKFVSNSYDCNALRYVMEQDDEIVLASINRSLYGLVHVRIPLKKETLIEIDLLYGKEIERYTVIKLAYMLLMEKVI